MGVNIINKSSSWLLFASLLVFLILAGPRCGAQPDIVSDGSDDPTTDTGGLFDADPLGDINLPGGDTNQTPGSGLDSGLNNSTAVYALLQQEKEKATESIKALQDDAILTLVSLKFVNGLSDNNLSTNYYIYLSASNPNYYYLVNIPRTGAGLKRFLMPKEDLSLPFNLLEIQEKFWKLSYADALQEVETRGGTAFRASHPNAFEVSVILALPAGQYTNWFVTYRATDGSGAQLKATVGSYDGETTIVES